MSYPYDLDVVFNSEQAAADTIGRLSFGTSSGGGSGDKILFRTGIYPVSNDYELFEDKDSTYFPTFNTQKEAYTEVEIKKSDWDSLPEDKKADLQLLALQYSQITSSSVSFYGFLVDSSSPQNQNKGIYLTSQDIDITSTNPPDCTLTPVTAKLYIIDTSTEIPTLTEVCTCKVKTYIDGVENKDSSYIPVLNKGLNNPVPVTRVEEDHTNFMYKTEPFSMNVGTGFGTDETVTVIAAFSNPVGITLDELVGRTYIIRNGKSFETFIQGSNTYLEAEVPGNYQDPGFQFPVTLTYSNEDSSISVQADIYTLDGNRPSTPITLKSNTDCSVSIIKKT